MAHSTIRATEETKRCLCSLADSAATAFATPGAELVPTGDGAFYRVPSLVVEAGRKVLLAAEAVDVRGGDELVRVCAVPFDVTRHQSRPAYATMENAPVGVELKALLGSRLYAWIIRTDVAYFEGDASRPAHVDAGILLKTDQGSRLLIDARWDQYSNAGVPVMPLDLILTTDLAAIDARLLGASLSPTRG